jgi:hypothetical protein
MTGSVTDPKTVLEKINVGEDKSIFSSHIGVTSTDFDYIPACLCY